MTAERDQLAAGIAALEAQRSLLGDAVADAALAPLRQRLAALAAPAEQRLRQVSVLFLDVAGSTQLGARLDPEDLHAVMDGLLARCTAIVRAHQGLVLQYAGDSLLAAFGATEAREDDVEQAVRAGLALLDEGRRWREAVHQRHGHAGVGVRVGIHTGPVLLGGGVDAEGSIRGSTVNIAARMEQSAPVGGLRISHDTYRHVRGVFDVAPEPPIAVKGVDEPLATYLVRGVKPRAFRVGTRGIEGIETRMIGRDAELGRLQAAFDALYAEGGLQVVTIVGDAGLGKSRLLYEFDNWAEARPETFRIFQGRATPQTQSQPYGLLRDILAWRLQIADDDAMDTARAKLEAGLAAVFDNASADGEAHAHLLGHLIGLDFSDSPHVRGALDDPKQIRSRGFHAALQLFQRAGEPAMLQLEDLHWADDGSLDFLEHLIQDSGTQPLLLLALTRPTLFERRSDWPPTGGTQQRLALAPLDKSMSRLLTQELLKKLPEVPVALRELVSGGADGNPFYMEELVKTLVDQGALEVGAERWTLHADRLLSARVPPTLTGLLQARLDGLPPAEKLALQQASVIGLVFWDRALEVLAPQALTALPALLRRELIVPRQGAGVDGEQEYTFRHQLLHQITYDTLLKPPRRDLHARTADWLAGLPGSRGQAQLAAAAEHYRRAGDAGRACACLAGAAEHARGRHAHAATLSHVDDALALMAQQPALAANAQLRWRLLNVRERTLDLLGRRDEQRVDIDALQSLADELDDDRRRGEVAWRRSDFAFRTGEVAGVDVPARQAMALAERVGDEALRLHALGRLAYAYHRRGDFDTAQTLAQQGLDSARAHGLRLNEALLLNVLGNVAASRDETALALQLDEQKLLIDRELGNLRNEAFTTGNLGASWLTLGALGEARRHLDESLRLSRAVGDRSQESAALTNLSRLALCTDDGALALAHAHAAVDVAIAVQDRYWQGIAAYCVGNAELALGRHAAAVAAFEQAQQLAVAIDSVMRFDALAGLARVAQAAGDAAGAWQRLKPLLAHLDSGGTWDGTEAARQIQLTCYELLAAAGDARAPAVLERAHAELQSLAASLGERRLQQGLIDNIPEHRRLVAAWAARQSDAQGRVSSTALT
jgi:predicted ATPase/class 3 adenylate cyclase